MDPTLEISVIEGVHEESWVCPPLEEEEEELMGVAQLEEWWENGKFKITSEWEPSEELVHVQKTKGRFLTCPMCSKYTQNKRHLKAHLPAYIIPDHHCWDCGRFLAQPGEARVNQHREKFGCTH